MCLDTTAEAMPPDLICGFKQKSLATLAVARVQTSLPARDCRAKQFHAEFDENQTMREL
jgi:hypothetical protein